MANKNEIVAREEGKVVTKTETSIEVHKHTTQGTITMLYDTLSDFAASEMSQSPLSSLPKYSTDDLLEREITLTDVDIIDYYDTANDKDVHYAMWGVTLDTGEQGHYCSGAMLTRFGDKLYAEGLVDMLKEQGIKIKLHSRKSAKGYNMVIPEVIR